jgi:hypothetical protein
MICVYCQEFHSSQHWNSYSHPNGLGLLELELQFTTGTQLFVTGTALITTGLDSPPLVTTGSPVVNNWEHWNTKYYWNTLGNTPGETY